MKRIITLSLFIISLGFTHAQVNENEYLQAEKFLSGNIRDIIYNSSAYPNFTTIEGNFWYKAKSRQGQEFFYVNAKKKSKQHAFDHEKMAIKLNEILKKEYTAWDLPFRSIQYKEKDFAFTFNIDTAKFEYNLKKKELKQVEKKKTWKQTERLSPDKKKLAFIKDYNLWIKDLESGKEIQLSTDGRYKYDYAASISWYYTKNESLGKEEEYEIDAYWSPDSKKIIVPRFNRDHARKLYMYKTQPEKGFRAEVFSYERPIAGDSLVTTKEYVLFNTETNTQTNIDIEPFAEFTSWGLNWFKNSSKAYIIKYSRGYQSRDVIEIDATTGKSRVILHESAETYVDVNTHMLETIDKSDEFIWASEQDGWQHLYLYDWKSGKLKNQITKGDYVVRTIEYVDQEKRKVYFTAGGMEEGRDPYLRHLYVVNFDGKGLKLLTPENAEHNISFSKKGKYFVDNYSRIDLPNIAVLRRAKDGKIIKQLETTDIEDLKALGWQAPELFKTKARDGKTDIYGVVFRPTNFDSNKKYPVIDGTYSGPQTIRAPKNFRRATQNNDLALAELGFIVVNIDGLGSAFRSKEFHDYSYKNLGDIGAIDHIKFIKDLAKKYSYIDTTRVGIYGHSAGGYDAVRALLTHPEFYKVGVSSAGNHDHRIAKAWWPELYMGYPAGPHYDEQSNFTHADKLTGKILLVHGDLDNNVNPTASMRMANHFIKANKDFDLLMIPNKDHSSVYYDKYFIRKRWDYFVKHLMGAEHPKEYQIK